VSESTVAVAPQLAHPAGAGSRIRAGGRALVTRRARLAVVTVVLVLVACLPVFGCASRQVGAPAAESPTRPEPIAYQASLTGL